MKTFWYKLGPINFVMSISIPIKWVKMMVSSGVFSNFLRPWSWFLDLTNTDVRPRQSSGIRILSNFWYDRKYCYWVHAKKRKIWNSYTIKFKAMLRHLLCDFCLFVGLLTGQDHISYTNTIHIYESCMIRIISEIIRYQQIPKEFWNCF